MLLAYRHVRICRLDVQIDVENFGNCPPHLDDPLLADAVDRILVTIDHIADSERAIEVVLVILVLRRWSGTGAAWVIRRCRESRLGLVARAVCATINMTEACIAQAAVASQFFFV